LAGTSSLDASEAGPAGLEALLSAADAAMVVDAAAIPPAENRPHDRKFWILVVGLPVLSGGIVIKVLADHKILRRK
jgi:hypothetical protein